MNDVTLKPKIFKMPVQGGMLEALGINLYANLGKCLVEFAANSYDSDANSVAIFIPFDKIKIARKKIRSDIKSNITSEDDPFSMLEVTLPADLEVTITDDGHGMTPVDVQDKFLPLNRNRRKIVGSDDPNLKSASGKRFVMGRKGLGKLAGFGAAEKVVIQTKMKNQKFVTEFCLDLKKLKSEKSLDEVEIDAVYTDRNDDTSFTKIILSRLKFGAVAQRQDTISRAISQNFYGIQPQDFKISINGEEVKQVDVNYEFIFPPETAADGMCHEAVLLPESEVKLPYAYKVMFRQRGDSLPASSRGVRIYCNNRLAAGPTLLNLDTGMHNFYAIDYMEMIVQADDLDRHGIDLINTNRTQLKSDNELVQEFFTRIEKHMKDAVNAHSKYRDAQTEVLLKEDPEAKIFTNIIARLPKKSREAGRKLLRIIAVQYGIGTPQFSELAPLVVQSMNATEVLVKLAEAGTKAETINEIASLLSELSEIEQEDAVKLFKARRSGIRSLSLLIDKGKELWNKKQFENQLHLLLKDNPWLIRPDLATHSSSDENLQKVASKIAKEIGVDKFAPIASEDGSLDLTRPDLIHIISDTAKPYEIHIVELKSPSLALDLNHVDQLETYIFKIEEFLGRHYDHQISIKGILIGTRPSLETTALAQRRLLKKISQNDLGSIEIVGLQELLTRTQRAHGEIIEVFTDQSEDGDG